jgi:hypothetical protein
MSLWWKNAQNVAKPIFNTDETFTEEQGAQIWRQVV